MKRITQSLIVAALTFGFGLACVGFYRASAPRQEVASIADELMPHQSMPQPDPYREAMLRAELFRLRGLIDRYTAEHATGLRPGVFPRSLDDLVREGYLREIPIDPVTGKREWQAEEVGCPSSGRWHSWGVTNVHSQSSAVSSEGTPYSEW